MIGKTRAVAPALLMCAAMLAPAADARAGGMYITDRGTRPLGRGFAFVAGADDAGALWYNPAGLAFAGEQFFLDTTITLFEGDFARVDSGGTRLPTVSTTPPILPIPMIAYTNSLGLEHFNFGAGVLVPNLVPFAWPEEIDAGGRPAPAPQRYSLISLDGSALAHIVIGASWQPTPELSIGASFQLIAGRLLARTALSACDGVICAQPENPEFDSMSEVDLAVVTPTVSAGIIYDTGMVRLGASVQAPHWIYGPASIRVRLPTASVFDGAWVDGDSGSMSLPMAWMLRVGAEVRPMRELRVEGSVVLEGWGIQQEMTISPSDVYMRDVRALGDYQVGDISIPRHMNNVWSFRLGGEYDLGPVTVRAGANYETTGFDDEYLTALTLDSNKLIVGLGASVEVSKGIFIDASYGHVFLEDREVTTSRVPQANPIRPPAPDPVYIGNGTYTMEANMFGVGMRWTFEPDATAPAEETDEPAEEPAEGPPPAEPPPAEQTEPPAPDGGTEEPPPTPENPETDDRPWYLRGRN